MSGYKSSYEHKLVIHLGDTLKMSDSDTKKKYNIWFSGKGELVAQFQDARRGVIRMDIDELLGELCERLEKEHKQAEKD